MARIGNCDINTIMADVGLANTAYILQIVRFVVLVVRATKYCWVFCMIFEKGMMMTNSICNQFAAQIIHGNNDNILRTSAVLIHKIATQHF